MKVLIVGATGSIGRHAVRAALDAGHDVTALARDPARISEHSESLQVAKGDVRDAESLRQATAGREAVLSCLGTTDRHDTTLRTEGARNIIEAMRAEGARRLVVMSAVGAGDSKAEVRSYSFFFGYVIMPLLLRGPFRDLEQMENTVRNSGLEWVIVRPTELTDGAGDAPVRVALDGKPAGAKVPRAAVARFMVEQLSGDAYLGKAPSLYG